MNISWTEPAVRDLESIKDFIARDSKYYANEFIERIFSIVENLMILPNRGRKVPEVDNENIKEIIFNNYRIIYRIEDFQNILILGIIHAAREIDKINPQPWEIN